MAGSEVSQINLFELYAKITLDTDDYRRSLDQSAKDTTAFSDKLKRGLATAAKVGTAAVGAATTAIGFLGKIGLDYNSQMEQYTTNFSTMLGSQEAAVKKVDELKEFAAKTPFEMSGLANATQTLLSFGIQSEDTMGIMKMLGDVSLGDSQKFDSLALVFGQVSSQGKLMGSDLLQMINAGFNPLQVISEKTGESMASLKERMSAGEITIDDVTQAFKWATEEGGKFYKGMEAGSQTTQGLISTLKDNIQSKLGEAFQVVSDKITELLPKAISFVDSINVDSVVGKVQELIGVFVNLTPVIAGATAAFLAYKAAMSIAALVDAAVKSVKAYQAANQGATAAQALLNTTLMANPFVLVATLVAALGTALVTLYMTNEDFRNKVNSAWSSIKDTISNAVAAISTFFTETIPNAAQKALDWFKSIPEKMKEVGKNLLEGLWNGITDKVQWLKDKVSGVVDTIKGWFTGSDGFDTHSPSKWFRSIGEFMMDGLALGMEDSRGKVMETAADIVSEVKNRFTSLADTLTLRQDVGDLEYQLWERTEGKGATEDEKYAKQLETLTSKQKDQASVVETAAAAYGAIVQQYGDSSRESYEYQKTLFKEMLAYQDLLDKIQEVSEARSRLYQNNAETINFSDSTAAKVSEASINAIKSQDIRQDVTLNAELVAPDGTKFANYYLPSMIKAAAANGTPIAGGQRA